MYVQKISVRVIFVENSVFTTQLNKLSTYINIVINIHLIYNHFFNLNIPKMMRVNTIINPMENK